MYQALAWASQSVRHSPALACWRRKWQPTPVFLPGGSHGQRNLAGCSSWGRKESDATERAHAQPSWGPSRCDWHELGSGPEDPRWGNPNRKCWPLPGEAALLCPCLRLTCSLAPDALQITGIPFKLTVNRDCAACAEPLKTEHNHHHALRIS